MFLEISADPLAASCTLRDISFVVALCSSTAVAIVLEMMLNGVKVTDYKEGDPVPERKFSFEPFRGPRPAMGYFGLQNHSDNDIVFFKEVAIKPLKK